MNSILHKTTASQRAPAAETAGKNQDNLDKDAELRQLRTDAAAALAAWRRAEKAQEQDLRLARVQRRRGDRRLGLRVMESYNLYDKLAAKLSWAESAARRQEPAPSNTGGFAAPQYPNRYTRNQPSQGTEVANRFSPLDESAKNSGVNQGF